MWVELSKISLARGTYEDRFYGGAQRRPPLPPICINALPLNAINSLLLRTILPLIV